MRIAQATSLSRATVSRILTRLKLNKIQMLEPGPPVVRYEHAAPGDMLHIDIKKLARIGAKEASSLHGAVFLCRLSVAAGHSGFFMAEAIGRPRR